MKKIKKPFVFTLSTVLVLSVFFLGVYPFFTYGQISAYEGPKIENWKPLSYDKEKKTVFIIADAKMTEMFDMLAPFYVFNATDQLNVYIVSENQTPIPLKKDLYVLPQMTFAQAEAMKLIADVIVVPALSARDQNQNPEIIDFIKRNYRIKTSIISICDGATTAAATGLYDGKKITAHATDYACVKKHWDKPVWVQDVTVAKSERTYSTAGVANAVEGALLVIEDLIGKEARAKAAQAVNYPHKQIRLEHKSIPLSLGNKLSILRRMIFHQKKLGLLLHDGLNELKFASIVDTYGRTYPKEFKTFTLQNSVVKTQYGLTFIHVGNNLINPKMDEVHVIMPELLTQSDQQYFRGFEMVCQNSSGYPIDQCIERISKQFGAHYAQVVKLTLDYN
ncbi:MAG: DJ-1/PfpI family protein [Flavobacteriaceae bacterium]